jgi:hypothetical protein
MINEKIQKFELELRKHNAFTNRNRIQMFESFFDLSLNFDDFKLFIDNQYKNTGYSFDLHFKDESNRQDLDYVEDIFIFTFKTPITLRNKLLKYMKKNNIEMIPLEKTEIILFCDGKVILNGGETTPFPTINSLRDLKKDRIACKVTFMPPIKMVLFDLLHIDFKRHYFSKKMPYKMKKEDIKEYLKLIDKQYKEQTTLTKREENRIEELSQLEQKEKTSKIEYVYKIDDNTPLIIIDRLWKFTDLEKILRGLWLSIPSKIRECLSSSLKYERSGKYKSQKKIDGMITFFDKLESYSKMKIADNIRDIRNDIENNENIFDFLQFDKYQNQLDQSIINISDFILELTNIFFLEMENLFEKKQYKFKK